jgi:hypothetical protein
MKRFLMSLFAVLRKTNEAKSAQTSRRSSPTSALEVRSQVKAGSFQWGVGRGITA